MKKALVALAILALAATSAYAWDGAGWDVGKTDSPTFTGPADFNMTFADATANEIGVNITGTQTGAGGDKTVLRLDQNGSGTGSEYIQEWYANNVVQMSITAAGTARVTTAIQTPKITTSSSTLVSLSFEGRGGALTGGPSFSFYPVSAWTNTTGDYAVLSITPTYNQASGTAANTALEVKPTETALGSGSQRLATFGTVAYPGQLSVSNRGHVSVKTGVAPTTSCTLTTGSNDHAGSITTCDGTTEWVNFGTVYANTPAVIVTSKTAAAWVSAKSASGFSITATANLDSVDYAVFGLNE